MPSGVYSCREGIKRGRPKGSKSRHGQNDDERVFERRRLLLAMEPCHIVTSDRWRYNSDEFPNVMEG